MNSQKVDTTIKQVQKQHLEDEEYLWTLESSETTLMKMEKPRCFNCNVYEYMAKGMQETKEE